MSRWLIEIRGEPIDREDYPRWFPAGDVFAVREGNQYFLTGLRFDQAGDATAVRDAADSALRELFGVVSLLWPSARLPVIAGVYYADDDDDGTRGHSPRASNAARGLWA